MATTPNSSAETLDGPGPGSTPVGPAVIAGSLATLLGIAVLVLYVMVKVWPHPTPTTAPVEDSVAVAQSSAGVPPQPEDTAADTAAQATAQTPAGTISPDILPRSGLREPVSYLWCTTAPADSLDRWVAIPGSYATATCVSLFGIPFPIWDEQLLLLLTLLGGALGGLVHAMRSLTWYVGNRELRRSWLPFYLSLPFVGAMLAVGFYILVRGGFFAGNTTIEDTSPFGFAALGFIVGMFSTQASLKLKDVADTFFTKPKPGSDTATAQSHAQSGGSGSGAPPVVPPRITAVTRQSRAQGAPADALVIHGTGFTADSTVKVNQDQPRAPEFRSATELVLPLAEADLGRIDAGGDFVLVVVQPGGEASDPYDYV